MISPKSFNNSLIREWQLRLETLDLLTQDFESLAHDFFRFHCASGFHGEDEFVVLFTQFHGFFDSEEVGVAGALNTKIALVLIFDFDHCVHLVVTEDFSWA